MYIAPNGACDALAVLILEVSGPGPWDTVTGAASNYAAAATTLNLALGAPGVPSFAIAAVCGDNSANGQAFAPASWTALHTVTASNGTDHTCDAVLTSAILPSTSSSASVNGTAVSAVDLSGAVIEFQISAASPVPANQNPNWAYLKYEMAFGAGFQTPQDELTWTDLTGRAWSWDETTGIQYQLGEIQATSLDVEADNFDNLLASDNPASYFYTHGGWAPQAAFYDNAVSGAPPLAWWKLADAAGSGTAADSSGNGHTGTATSVTFGNANEAVTGNTSASFASGSTSHVISSYNPALSAVTVEAWANLNGQSQSGVPRIIADSNTASDSRGFELLLAGGGNNLPQIWFGNGTAFGAVSAAAVLPAAGWTYLAATWDGTTITLYVNGVSQGTSALAGSMPSGTAAGIGIGYGAAFAGSYFSGLIAECAVYGLALTPAQVAARYTAGPGVTGTPLRIRAALGTIGGQTVNRWYVISRNLQEWPQQIDEDYRRYIPGTGTDIWSAMSAAGPTPYRGEIRQEASLYAWWPMDDQPLAGGVQPTSLLNAAPGNTNTLSITGATAGVAAADAYSTTGTDLTATGTSSTTPPLPSVATYATAQQAGWMYGDPQSGQASYQTSNPVTASPGSAAWQQTGLQGNTGAQGFFLTGNDANYPPLSGGVTVSGWFNATFFGTATGYTAPSLVKYVVAGQPYAPVTLCTLSTGTAPVCELQLDRDTGHLNLITFNGTTPTTNAVYTSSDLRSGSWVGVHVTLTTTTWAVYVDGGMTAAASGSATGMTSAWTWLTIGGDYGNTSGGSAPANLVHGGNVAYSHWAVYSAQLPAWRILAHYCAASTAFGLVPAPQTLSLSKVANKLQGQGYTPDGSEFQGTYGKTGVSSVGSYTFSAVAVAEIGSYTSGPSARTAAAGYGTDNGGNFYGDAVWVSWTSLSPSVGVYTASSASGETNAATAAGSGDSFVSGYGNTASGGGVCQTAAGSGASAPVSASALGDTVQQRVERILGYTGVASGRCVDPAALQVQAATDIGGQQAGPNCQNVTRSDGGMLFIDNLGLLTYWQRSHLASQYSTPAWTIGPNTAGGVLAYDRTIQWIADPQRVWNSVTVEPFSPDGASLPLITPTSATAVDASQLQFGAQPKSVTSYLQSTAAMQSFANWLAANFGQVETRADNIKIDAASQPAAWPLVLGLNVGDVVSVQNWQIGGGGLTGTFRVTRIKRKFTFGAGGSEASVTITADWEPGSYWV